VRSTDTGWAGGSTARTRASSPNPLYGAFPWIDVARGYGALVTIEADGDLGAERWSTVKPSLDQAFDSGLGRP
jgi:hypothetical protein